jgi:S-adenosylmethionine:tRNA-ribosyltransferase-isomerase (queuine synthetase)
LTTVPSKTRSLGRLPNANSAPGRNSLGFKFSAVIVTSKRMQENRFFRPYQSLFMLVSALMGTDRMKAAYACAIENDYRFYSYGDASLLLP